LNGIAIEKNYKRVYFTYSKKVIMKIRSVFPTAVTIVCAFSFAACSSGWDSESKDLFHQSCLEDAKERGLNEAKAKSVCDCRLETAQKKYPTLSDAMANVEKMMNDEDLKKCE
jgi:hypothetical protein